jgi:2-polyprenyl-6-methoxyphenol hydroxylase-like FAD-dependent oxidoreductase
VNRQELGILNIAGRVPVTAELAARLPDTLTDGSVNNIVPAGPGWMFAATWRIDPGATPAAANPATYFLVWAWAAGRQSYPADIDSRTPAQLRDLVIERVARWSPAVRHLIAVTDPATVAPVSLRTMPQLTAWAPSAVTLLGDAIHNMTPMAGIGANTALRDADQLRRALLAPGPGDVTARVGAYEEQMRGYANQALALSARNARNAASPARLPRIAFRSALRIAETLPAAKRRMFRASPAPAAS